MPDKDKEKLEAVKKIPNARPEGSAPPAASGPAPPLSINISEQRSHGPLFKGGTSGFKPFAKNPEKQQRYEHYLDLRRRGKKCESILKVCKKPTNCS